MTYAEVAERRKNMGAGIAELHQRIGITAHNHGVGIWSQNRPEWQITGQFLRVYVPAQLGSIDN
jgi:long-chain acyl-CoA synthetase